MLPEAALHHRHGMLIYYRVTNIERLLETDFYVCYPPIMEAVTSIVILKGPNLIRELRIIEYFTLQYYIVVGLIECHLLSGDLTIYGIV